MSLRHEIVIERKCTTLRVPQQLRALYRRKTSRPIINVKPYFRVRGMCQQDSATHPSELITEYTSKIVTLIMMEDDTVNISSPATFRDYR